MLTLIFALASIQDASNPINRDRIDKAVPAPVIERNKPQGLATVDTMGNGRPIAGIRFLGTDAPPEVARAAEQFIGKPNNAQTLGELVTALTDAYSKSRVALFTIAIPAQSFDENVVEVLLTEAGVEEVLIEGTGKYARLERLAAPLTGQRPLSRSTFERQISLMRAVPGVSFDLGVENPDHDQDVTLRLKAKRKRIEAAVGVNNRGPDLVGDFLFDGRIDFYSLAGDGDRLRLSAASSINPNRYRQFSVAYDRPIGDSGLQVGVNGALVRTRAKRFDLQGKAKLAGITLTYPLIRRFDRAADLSLSFDGVNSENAAFGNVISSDRTRALRAGGGYSRASKSSLLQASLVASKGLDILGARVNPLVSEANFLKANASLAYSRDLSKRITARGSAVAQYSRDRLPGAELFAVGGSQVGRAFDTAFLSGDRGVGGSIELAFRPIAAGKFSKSEIYAYSDAAQLTVEARSIFPQTRYDFVTAGVGARGRWNDKIELAVEAAHVLDRPTSAYDDQWRLSFGYRLSL